MDEIRAEKIKAYIWSLSETDAYKSQRFLVELTDDLIDEIMEEVDDSLRFISKSQPLDEEKRSFLEKYYAKRMTFEKISGFVYEELSECIPDTEAEKEIEAPAHTMLHEQLVYVSGALTERERKVLKLRYGLEDDWTGTGPLEEIGREFDVTGERICQTEDRALRKLRHPTRSKKLKDYLDSDHNDPEMKEKQSEELRIRKERQEQLRKEERIFTLLQGSMEEPPMSYKDLMIFRRHRTITIPPVWSSWIRNSAPQ